MLRPYDKPHLSFDEQLNLLSERGMVINDKKQALHTLASTNYYRLSAYWYPFRIRDEAGNATETFESNTTIDVIVSIYEFDRELRLAVMDAIERVEIAARTQLAIQLACAHGAFGHTIPTNFHDGFRHADWLHNVEEESKRSKEEFIRHYRKTYEGFPRLPIWMATEIMSLGSISRLYGGLKHEDKKPIAKWFGLHHKNLVDWLHVLTYIRNICAHHGRLWNRKLAIKPEQESPFWQTPHEPRNDRVFIVLLMLRHLLAAISTGDEWQERCSKLLKPMASNPRWRESMGFPENWQEHPLWIRREEQSSELINDKGLTRLPSPKINTAQPRESPRG